MSDFEYGPVEILLIGFEGDRPGPAVVAAMNDVIKAGAVKLLDLTFISKSESGELTVLELDQVSEEYGFGTVELEQNGLAADEDLDYLASEIPDGSSAAVLVIEHVWARMFAQRLAEANGAVIDSQRIPAPIVNAALADAE